MRGLSLRITATLAGLSPAFLSMVENGERDLDRIDHAVALADVLRVSPADLVGQSLVPSTQGHVPADSLNRLRIALLAAQPPYSSTFPGDPCSADELSASIDHLARLCDRCEYLQVVRRLPDLLTSAHALLASRSILAIYQRICIPALKELGCLDLLALTLERSHTLSAQFGDPVDQAVAAWQRSQLCTRLGLYEHSAATAMTAAAELSSSSLRTPRARAAYGRLHITAALAHARLNPSNSLAVEHLTEAEGVAVRLDRQCVQHDDIRLSQMSVLLNKIELFGVLGDFDGVCATLRDPTVEKPRDVIDDYSFHLLVGWSMAHLRGKEQRAVTHLLHAEKIAPQALRAESYARRAVATLVDRPNHGSVSVNLRGLAHRMGLFQQAVKPAWSGTR